MRSAWGGRVWRRAGTFACCCWGTSRGLDSERAIAWRAQDSLSIRRFLGLGLTDASPDHSTISRTRRRIDVEAHRRVFFVGAWSSGGVGSVVGEDGGRGRDDAGGERGAAEHRASGRPSSTRDRRRIRGSRGKRTQRQRGERLERPLAHQYGTGGMRRVHLCAVASNILKRVLIHASACNLGLLMRQIAEVGLSSRSASSATCDLKAAVNFRPFLFNPDSSSQSRSAP